MLSARERQRLRDRIAREAVRRNIPNPLLTRDEIESQGFTLLALALDRSMDREKWKHRLARRDPRILEERRKR